MGVHGIEDAADLRQQRIVVGEALARAGEHGLEAARFGHEALADVQRTHHGAEPCQRRIAIQAECRGQHFEGDARADVRELGAVEVEADRVRRAVPGGVQPQEACVAVDEAADQPGAGDPVHPQPAPRGPGPSAIGGRVAPPDGLVARVRLTRRQAQLGRPDELAQGRRGLLAGVVRKIIDGAQRVMVAAQPAQAAPDVLRRHGGQRLRAAGQGASPCLVLGAAIEQRSITGFFLFRSGMHAGQPGRPVLACDVVGKRAQLRFQGGQGRQQIGAVAQRRTTERLQRAPDAYAQRRAVAGQAHDKQLPLRGFVHAGDCLYG